MKNNLKIFLAIVVVLGITAVAFLPSLQNDFVDAWDDAAYITENEVIKELSWKNIRKMFTSGFLGHYCPLIIMSFALEHHFFGLDALYYHLTNYLLHLSIVALVFYFIYMISGKSVGIAFIT